MNEITPRWLDHPEWAMWFVESDRLLVDSMFRYALERRTEPHAWSSADDDLILALLTLSSALRLEHVALALDPDALERFLGDQQPPAATNQLGSLDLRARAERIISALATNRSPLAQQLIETTSLDQSVALRGPPIIVSSLDGTALFAHLRRLGYAEWRLAAALLEATEPPVAGPLDRFGVDDLRLPLAGEPAAAAVTERLLRHRISIVTGGPGTGKTTAVARMLQTIGDLARHRRADSGTSAKLTIGLCAPTAKAAVRLGDALAAAFAAQGTDLAAYDDVMVISNRSGSVHRLLGLRPDLVESAEPLALDLVIVDEMSMLELPLLDQLVSRMAPSARIVLVGDPDQLASVNVGAALRDVVDAATPGDPLEDLVTRLTVNHRSNVGIQSLARAINDGDANGVLALANEHADTVTISPDRSRQVTTVRTWSLSLVEGATNGDGKDLLDRLNERVVLCATREGAGSVAWWRTSVETTVRRRSGSSARFAPGTPVLVTRNEWEEATSTNMPLTNGDVGVAVRQNGEDLVIFGPRESPRRRTPFELHEAESAWSMTIHKSQGSEYDHVTVSLPEFDVPILTRELLYTAITRARSSVAIVVDEPVLRRALERRIARVSGLAERTRALRRATPINRTTE